MINYKLIYSLTIIFIIFIILLIIIIIGYRKIHNINEFTNEEIKKLGNNILIVGNSPDILKIKKGKLIDKFDEVVRFNNFKIIPEYSGTKTTIWVRHKPIKKKVDYKYILYTNNCNKIYTSNNLKNFIKIFYCLLYIRLIKTKNARLMQSQNLYIKNNKKNIVIHPTSGLTTILYFLKFYDIVYIYGFSFDTTHYYNDVSSKLTNKNISAHSYEIEKKIIEKLIHEKKIIVL